jgi:diguanylate cyclase (GGDEF)-like protein
MHQSVLVASILMTGLVWGIRQIGLLQYLELTTFDQMVRLQPSPNPDPRLLVVAITEADLQQQKQWPISDRTLAQVLEKLQQHKPKVIGLDLYRNIPQPPGHDAFLKQLQASNVVTIYNFGDVDAEGVPSIPGVSSEQVGFNDLVIDPDNVVRRNLIYAYQGKQHYLSFSLRVSLKYLADRDISFKAAPYPLLLGNTKLPPPLSSNSGGYQNIDSAGYQILISYRSPHNLARQISLSQLLNGEFNPDWVKEKVVLIGTTAPSLNDLFLTPYSAAESTNPALPGVLLHAQLVSQILSISLDQKPNFWFWYEWVEVLWVLVWALIGGVLAWRFRHPLILGMETIISLGILYSICFIIFTLAGWIPFLPPTLAFLVTLGSVLAYKLLHDALHDSLTGLPNRDLFIIYLKRAIANSQRHQKMPFAVLLLNLDRFRIVNESLGYQVGDQLLINAANRLKNSVGCREKIARVAGDEFAILLENIKDASEATNLADWLQQQMTLPFCKHGQEIFITVSIGIALNQTELDYLPANLLRDAQIAMYRAKVLGKARHQIFATGMHTQLCKRFQLETDLYKAIEQEEIYLVYQPIVSLISEKVAGFEALIRWNHPQHGFVSPGEFIPVAEETGFIIPLGKWIFKEACRQLRVWQTQFSINPPLTMSINLSGKQLTQPDLVEYIEQTLKDTNLDGRNLKLEMTESVAMHDVEAAISIMLKLRKLNLKFSIDDFGTGYSSLSYLHRFPINTLKVDRSFVSKMEATDEDAAIVQTIIMLSHALGMDVVAEGIEKASQKAKLQALGCEYGQGYFFSKPIDSKTVTALLESQFNLNLTTEKRGVGV